MYEYVITAGEGTIIELDVLMFIEDIGLDVALKEGEELIVRRCNDDCETGQ